MQVLKIATAGSVDDGKSTLIGRLLYDTNSLTDDKIEAIERSSKNKGYDYLDFSLATDGLVAEREQGITIDVAHIYFSTPKRSYIIADTPGHVEYTRNMVTGASTSQVAIILIDARKGVVEQTKRHFFINSLLRTKQIIVAVNKMDLVDFSEERFNEIIEQVKSLAADSDYQEQVITFIPISAKNGDNVVSKSDETPWYSGVSLLDRLENIELNDVTEKGHARFSIQTVIRPKKEEFHDFRGFAGKLKGGDLSVGDEITVLPSLTKSRVKEIHFYNQTYDRAEAGASIVVTLEDEVNASRGDVFVKSNELPRIEKEITASVCWMDKEPLRLSGKYLIKHGTHDLVSKVDNIEAVINTDFSGEIQGVDALTLNQIGKVKLKLSKPMYYDTFRENKSNGAFIIIDAQTNNTAGVGVVVQ
jgi:sulfate adenylyltransferase subunit 1